MTRRLQGLLLIPLLLSLVVVAPVPARAAEPYTFADSAFDLVWARTDADVAAQKVTRSWVWGPGPGVAGLEPYKEAPGGQRLVQYFDKARMEVNDPSANPANAWFSTNGLLTVELMTGRMQTGDSAYEQRDPAALPLAGDTDDASAPTYATFLGVSNTPRGEHRASDRRGQVVTEVINRAGQVTPDPDKSSYLGLRVMNYDTRTGHNIPEIFWNFLNQSGPVRKDRKTVTAPLLDPWLNAMGLPISEAYWARVKVAGKMEDVLIQAFERRVLTYQPSAPAAWRVQMGNIGLHYYEWRYGATWYDGKIGPAARAAVTPGMPKQIVIPRLGLRTTVEHVGKDAKGNMDVPKDPWNVAWYAPGARPGAIGNAAIAGHLDWHGVGPVVFYNLKDLAPGDMVYVRDESGRDRAFRVLRNTTCPFDDCPLTEIFGANTRPRLNLITCQGTFDRTARNYNNRQVVYTELVP
jgi:hypothetical protein